LKLKQDENKEYWEKRAEKFVDHQVSWWDINMKKIEIDTITGLLSPDDYVLDVGCSNGATTRELQEKTGARFLGIDYSENAIRQAKEYESPRLIDYSENAPQQTRTDDILFLTFEHKSILDFQEQEIFDKAISVRCLINLMEYADQLQALRNIHACLKPGGLYIMCEAFSGALGNLNRAREVFGLAPLPMPAYNNYFDEDELATAIQGMFSIEGVIKHSSLYYIGTRIFQYMSMDAEPKEPDTELHRFFAHYGLETGKSGDFGPNKVYLLKKI